jgi:hypothetical protein
MISAKKGRRPTKYMIRVKSHLDLHWTDWFDGIAIIHTEDGHTILTGEIIDQPALHGLLEKIRNLNLILVSVEQMDEEE